MKQKAPITFRAYADEKRRYWVEVRLFKSAHAMRRDIRSCLCCSMKELSAVVAMVTNGERWSKSGRKTGAFAVMWLNECYVQKYPSEVVAHESVHAAIRYFNRRGWPVCLAHESEHDAPDAHERRLEERLAYATGRIAKHVARGLFRHGVWK